VARFIERGFEQEGQAVDVVHDGEAAVAHALSFDYDVVVLDIMLPRLSGMEVVSAVRAKKPRLPVIMLTARGEVEDRLRASTRVRMTTWSNPSPSQNSPHAFAP
jgi:DNA-binding response OmpR family regulator